MVLQPGQHPGRALEARRIHQGVLPLAHLHVEALGNPGGAALGGNSHTVIMGQGGHDG